MSITIHYIDDQFELFDRTMHVKQLRDASHTMIMIKEEFQEGLKAFGLEKFKHEQFIVVSDSGSNCSGAEGIRSVYDWHPCIDHKIATCLTPVLNKTISMRDGRRRPAYKYFDSAPELFNLIDDVKDLVTYFKQANLQHQLPKTLKQENATRWNSLLRCLQSVQDVFDEVVNVLMEKRKMSKVARIAEDLLGELIAFLNEFQLATLALEKFKEPTIHKVIYWRHRLLTHLVIIDDHAAENNGNLTADSGPISVINDIVRPIVEEKFVIEPIHVVGAMLDPAQKHRLGKFGISGLQLQEGRQQFKVYMKSIGMASINDNKDQANCNIDPPPAKKRRTEKRLTRTVVSQYSDDEDDDENEPGMSSTINLDAQIEVEFDKYMQYKVSKNERLDMYELSKEEKAANTKSKSSEGSDCEDVFQVLTWWKHIGVTAFPIVARVARSILCVPASSAKSECNFSDAGNTITSKRSRLSPSVVNDLMFLRSNHDLQ